MYAYLQYIRLNTYLLNIIISVTAFGFNKACDRVEYVYTLPQTLPKERVLGSVIDTTYVGALVVAGHFLSMSNSADVEF